MGARRSYLFAAALQLRPNSKGLEALAHDDPRLERPMRHTLDQRAAVDTVGVAGPRTGITCTQHTHQSAEKRRSDTCKQARDVP